MVSDVKTNVFTVANVAVLDRGTSPLAAYTDSRPHWNKQDRDLFVHSYPKQVKICNRDMWFHGVSIMENPPFSSNMSSNRKWNPSVQTWNRAVVFFPPFYPSLHFKTPQIYLVTPLKVGKKNKGAAGLPVHVLRMMQWSMMGLQLTVISKQWCALWCWADLSSGLNCSSRDKNNCHIGGFKNTSWCTVHVACINSQKKETNSHLTLMVMYPT